MYNLRVHGLCHYPIVMYCMHCTTAVKATQGEQNRWQLGGNYTLILVEYVIGLLPEA